MKLNIKLVIGAACLASLLPAVAGCQSVGSSSTPSVDAFKGGPAPPGAAEAAKAADQKRLAAAQQGPPK